MRYFRYLSTFVPRFRRQESATVTEFQAARLCVEPVKDLGRPNFDKQSGRGIEHDVPKPSRRMKC